MSGGGHSLAAGLTIKKEKFKTFVKFINEQVILKKKENRTIKYLSKIDLSAVNLNFCKEFNLLEPYGPFNSKPFF